MKKAMDDKQAAAKQCVKYAQALADAELHSRELLSRVAGNRMYLKNMKDAMSSLKARVAFPQILGLMTITNVCLCPPCSQCSITNGTAGNGESLRASSKAWPCAIAMV